MRWDYIYSILHCISKSNHRPPNRPPSPPAYRPVRHKRQKSKETEFELGEEVDYRWVGGVVE